MTAIICPDISMALRTFLSSVSFDCPWSPCSAFTEALAASPSCPANPFGSVVLDFVVFCGISVSVVLRLLILFIIVFFTPFPDPRPRGCGRSSVIRRC